MADNGGGRGCIYTFRTEWVPLTKKIVATLTDLISDWVFFAGLDPDIVSGNIQLASFIFSFISTVLSFFCIRRSIQKIRERHRTGRGFGTSYGGLYKKIQVISETILYYDIFIEDIPQFILSLIVANTMGEFTAIAVFNATASGLNLVLGVLDMMELTPNAANEMVLKTLENPNNLDTGGIRDAGLEFQTPEVDDDEQLLTKRIT